MSAQIDYEVAAFSSLRIEAITDFLNERAKKDFKLVHCYNWDNKIVLIMSRIVCEKKS